MVNYLATLANAIGGLLSGGQTSTGSPVQGGGTPASASPVPPAPPNATAPSAPSPSSGGFVQGAENFLGSPLTQSALAGYFGAIGSPKKAGLGGMLSRGGLSGLSAYDTAQEAQQKAALQAAQLPQMQAQTAATQAQTQLTQAQAAQKAGIRQNNAVTAAALRIFAMQPGRTPDQQQAALFIANAVENDMNTPYKASDLMTAVLTDPAKAQEAIASTNLKTAQTKAVPSTIARNQAATNEAAANAAAIPERTAIEQEKADAEKTKAAATPASKANPLTNLKTLQALYTAQYGGVTGTIESGASKLIGGAGRPTFEQFAIRQGYDPASGQPLGPAPSGMTWRFDPVQNRAETIDASGKVTGYFSPS